MCKTNNNFRIGMTNRKLAKMLWNNNDGFDSKAKEIEKFIYNLIYKFI